MEVNVETVGPSMAKLTLTVPPEEFQTRYRSGLRRAGQGVRMKGFRPGKVPEQVLERRFGEQVRQEVMESFLQEAYQRAVRDENLKPISHPRVPDGALEPAEDGSFTLDLEISLRPEFVLPDYRSLTIESELEPVTAEQVEAVIEDITRQESVPEPAGEEGLKEEGLVLCDVAFLFEDEVVFEREGLRLGGHTPPPGVDAEAYRQVLLGAKEGDELQLPAILPPTIENEAARGQPGQCRLTIRQAFNMVPPTEAELFEKLEVEDAEGLRVKIRARLEEASRERELARVEGALLDRLIEQTDLELPASLVQEQTESHLHQLAHKMREQDVPAERIEREIEEQRSTAREEADKGLRALLIVEAIGEKEELLVSHDELDEELGRIAERNGVELAEVKQYYSENNLGQQLSIELLERKVRTFLRENARVTAPS